MSEEPTDNPEQDFIAFIRIMRDDENAARRHRRIEYEEENRTLADLFDESLPGNENLSLLLAALREKKSVRADTEGVPLVVPGRPDESLFMRLITEGGDEEIRSMSRNFGDEGRAIARRWIESLPEVLPEPVQPIQPLFK